MTDIDEVVSFARLDGLAADFTKRALELAGGAPDISGMTHARTRCELASISIPRAACSDRRAWEFSLRIALMIGAEGLLVRDSLSEFMYHAEDHLYEPWETLKPRRGDYRTDEEYAEAEYKYHLGDRYLRTWEEAWRELVAIRDGETDPESALGRMARRLDFDPRHEPQPPPVILNQDTMEIQVGAQRVKVTAPTKWDLLVELDEARKSGDGWLPIGDRETKNKFDNLSRWLKRPGRDLDPKLVFERKNKRARLRGPYVPDKRT